MATFNLGNVVSPISQQLRLAQLSEAQNPDLALQREIQKAVQLQQLRAQSPEGQLALQLQQAQLQSALQNQAYQQQQQPLLLKQLETQLQELQDPSLAQERKFNEALRTAAAQPDSAVRRAGVGAPPTGEIEPIFTPKGVESPFVIDPNKSIDYATKLANAKRKDQFTPIGMTLDGKNTIAYNHETGKNVLQPVPQPSTGEGGITNLPGKGGSAQRPKVYSVINPDGTPETSFFTDAELKDFIDQGGRLSPKPDHAAEKAKSTELDRLARSVQSNKPFQAFRTVHDAVGGLEETLQYAQENPNDQTGIKSSAVDAFNKIVNPNSVVRQQAFSQTTSGQSLISKAENFFSGLATGQTITIAQIQSMLDLARKYEDGARKSVQAELKVIKHRGDKAGLDPQDYLPDLFSEGGQISSPVGTVGINPKGTNPVQPTGLPQVIKTTPHAP